MKTPINFDQLVYFGDSLTDSDEFFNASAAVAFFGIECFHAVISDLVSGTAGAGTARLFRTAGWQDIYLCNTPADRKRCMHRSRFRNGK